MRSAARKARRNERRHLNAFRLPDMPVGSLLALLQQFRAQAEPMAEALLVKQVALEVAEVIDRAALGHTVEGIERPLSTVWGQTNAAWLETKRERRRHPKIDIECEIAILFAEGAILGIIFTEQHELVDLWKNISGAKDFSYWSGDERPKSISEEEWAERERLWDLAMPSSCPMKHGLSLTLIGDFLPQPDNEVFVAAQPPLDERVALLARDQVLSDLMKEPEEGAPPHQWVRAMMEARDKLREPAGQERLTSVRAGIATKLKPALDIVDFLGWDPAAPSVRS